MDQQGMPVPVRSELFTVLEQSPAFLDQHARWLAAGGDRVLAALVASARGDMFPWTAEAHVQAAFGAFVGGVAHAARVLGQLTVLHANREQARKLITQDGGKISAAEREMLQRDYGYSDAELKKFEQQ